MGPRRCREGFRRGLLQFCCIPENTRSRDWLWAVGEPRTGKSAYAAHPRRLQAKWLQLMILPPSSHVTVAQVVSNNSTFTTAPIASCVPHGHDHAQRHMLTAKPSLSVDALERSRAGGGGSPRWVTGACGPHRSAVVARNRVHLDRHFGKNRKEHPPPAASVAAHCSRILHLGLALHLPRSGNRPNRVSTSK